MFDVSFQDDFAVGIDRAFQAFQNGVSRSTLSSVSFSSGVEANGTIGGAGLRWPFFSGDTPSGTIQHMAFGRVALPENLSESIRIVEVLRFDGLTLAVADWVDWTEISPTLALWRFDMARFTDLLDREDLDARGSGGADMMAPGSEVRLSGDDRITGRGGADMLDAGAGRDTVFGGVGADTLKGGKGDDRLTGGKGADFLKGQSGHDRLTGGGAADLLLGGSGHDRLYGIAGRDTLTGERGDDTLTGGSGRDMFVFKGRFGTDVITDLTAGDTIVMDRKAIGGSLKTALAAAEITESGLFLDLAKGALLLQGIDDPELLADVLTLS